MFSFWFVNSVFGWLVWFGALVENWNCWMRNEKAWWLLINCDCTLNESWVKKLMWGCFRFAHYNFNLVWCVIKFTIHYFLVLQYFWTNLDLFPKSKKWNRFGISSNDIESLVTLGWQNKIINTFRYRCKLGRQAKI